VLWDVAVYFLPLSANIFQFTRDLSNPAARDADSSDGEAKHMLKTLIEKLGDVVIRKFESGKDASRFAIMCCREMRRLTNYNSAVQDVLIMQIYFTALQILVPFLIFSVIFSSFVLGIIVEKIKEMGLTHYLGDILAGIIFVEIAPLLTVFLIAQRSGSAINAEIAVMKVHNEIKSLEYFGIDPVVYLFVPRIISIMFCIIVFDILFSIIIFLIGSLFSFGILGLAHEQYADIFLESIELSDFALVFGKLLVFGFFVAFIPIYNGYHISIKKLTDIPIAVLNGMVNLFVAITVIETCSLILRFI